jgi:hypothetical protein
LGTYITNNGCVLRFKVAIYIKKYIKVKEELWKLKYFYDAKVYISKNPLKETQNPSRCIITL